MQTLTSIGKAIAARRKQLGLSQAALSKQAKIGHSTFDALENSRIGELGTTKIIKLLSALGLELKIQEAASRPTLEELMEEDRDDQGLDRQR
jgi:transcriptional regulator with XRE-family HTH domain